MAKLIKMRRRRHTSSVRMSMLCVVLPRWRSQGLSCGASFSQNLSEGKDWRGLTLSEGVFDTARPPQCEFPNLRKLSLTFLLEVLCWPVIEFYYASCAARAETWRWLREVIIFQCIFVLGNHFFIRISPGLPGLTCWNPSLKLVLPLRKKITTGWFLILEKVFRNDYIAACSTARRSATEKNEIGGYVNVPCSSKMTKQKSTADWLKFLWRHRIGSDGTRTEQIFTPSLV